MKKLVIAIFSLFAFSGILAQSIPNFWVPTSGTNTYTTNISGWTNYTNKIGFVSFTNGNTSTATINVNSIGAAALRKWDGDSWEALVSGDIPANSHCIITYNGSYFETHILRNGAEFKDILDQVSTSTAGGTITLDFDLKKQRMFYGSASFSSSKVLAVSDTTNALDFDAFFQITNVAGTIEFPTNWVTSDDRVVAHVFTPTSTGYYEIGGTKNTSSNTWNVKIFPGVSSTALTDGSGTTANGSSADLGGTLTSDATIDGSHTFTLQDLTAFDVEFSEGVSSGAVSKISQSGGWEDLIYLHGDATKYSEFFGTGNASLASVGLQVTSGSENVSIVGDAYTNTLQVRDNRTTTAGLEYEADYSAEYTSRSLVDKGFVVAGYVPTSRTISTTSPLSGGGDLSANRTLTIANSAADGSTKGAASFNATYFDASSGNISPDLTNGLASGSQGGYLSSTDYSEFNTEPFVIACSDEVTALTTGTKVTFRMPRARTLVGIRGSLTTAQGSGSILTIDVKESGTTVLSTLLTIDNTEKTSTTAATAPVISDSALADDAEMTIIITQVGASTVAAGLKVTLFFN